MSKQIVLIYSIIHFIVDFACMALVTTLAEQYHASLWMAIVSYNFFAFFMQFPLGIVADRLDKNALVAASGCVLILGALLCTPFPFYTCIIAGLGNALFHLGGGIDVLNISRKRATQIGIFVSTGTLGIFFGKSMPHHLGIIAFLLVMSIGLLLHVYRSSYGKFNNLPMIFPIITPGKLLVALGLTSTVCLRSYVGCMTIFAWKSYYLLAVLAVSAVVLGKMLGGMIGDRIGFIQTAAISLLISAGTFWFAFNNSVAGLIALVCFNMTMPLTLTMLANLMPHNKGLAFGILTAALFLGGFPAFLGVKFLATGPGLSLLSVLSAVLLIPSIYQGKKYVA